MLGQKAKIKAELVFESEDGIQILNKRERGVDSVTDVLSFPSLDGIKGVVLKPENCFTEMDGGYIFIGSIVLCEEKIKEQAAEIGHSEERETQYLIIHGLMHLFGYDHLTDEDNAEMREKEKDPTIPSNIIYNALGVGDSVFADVEDITQKVIPGDKFIICSDGLSDMADDETIESVMENGGSAPELVAAAKEAGGKDNVSVIVVEIIE